MIKEKGWVLRDIGHLDGHLILSNKKRIDRGAKSVCDACRREISDENFIGGIKKGFQNMSFHVDCVPESERGNRMGGQ